MKEKIKSFLNRENLRNYGVKSIFYATLLFPILSLSEGNPQAAAAFLSFLGLNLYANFMQKEYNKTQQNESIEKFKNKIQTDEKFRKEISKFLEEYWEDFDFAINKLSREDRKFIVESFKSELERFPEFKKIFQEINSKLDLIIDILNLTGLNICLNTEELIKGFDAVRRDVKIVERNDAKNLANKFEKSNGYVVVESQALVGKSFFAYLVGLEWIKKGEIVAVAKQNLLPADRAFLKNNKNVLVIIDFSNFASYELKLTSFGDAKKVLIVRRFGEPNTLAGRELDYNINPIRNYLYTDDIVKEKIKCELGEIEDVGGVIYSIEEEFGIRAEDDVKGLIMKIITTAKGNTLLGAIKAFYVGFKSMIEQGEISSPITLEDFNKLPNVEEMREFEASDKILYHIFNWLPSDVKNLIRTFRFLQEYFGTTIFFNSNVVDEIFRIRYNKSVDEALDEVKRLKIVIYDKYTKPFYIVWHSWQVEIVDINDIRITPHQKQEILAHLEKILSSLEGKDKYWTIFDLGRIFWKEDRKKGISYLKQCISSDFADIGIMAGSFLVSRILERIDFEAPNKDLISNNFDMLGTDETANEVKLNVLTVPFFLLYGKTLTKWIGFVNELALETLKDVEGGYENFYSMGVSNITESEKLNREEKESWIGFVNELALETLKDVKWGYENFYSMGVSNIT
ncbi:MAG: hypothetical protein ACE5K0_08265, partial [Candidatus Methanofastidiosia archaeon]